MDAPAADDIDVPAAAAPAVAAAADDLVVKKIRRRKTAATTSRRHAEIETGGVAFVPSGPIQRAVVAPGETARIDRATLDAVLGRTAPVEEPPAPVAVVAAAPAAQPAPAAAAIVEPTTIERPLLDRTASEPVVVHEAQKSFSRMLTGNVQKMASSTKEKIASASRQADDLLKSNALVRKLERQDENTATTSAVAPTPTAGVAPAVDAAVPTPTPRAAVSPTVALQQLLRTAVPPCTRVSEMPFDALSVDRRDECSLPLDLCGFRWRRTSRRLIGTLSGWYRDNVATASSSVGDAPRAAVAELLSACMWTEAFAPDAALTFVRAASATHCLDVDDALRCVNMRALNDCVAFLVGTEREASDGLELVRAGCRTRDLLRTLPTLLAASAPDETRREALEVCVANFPVVQARNVAAWLGVATAEAAAAAASTDANDGATVLYLLYSRLLLETHTAMRYDAPFVTTMLGVLLRDGAPPRTDVLDSVSGRFKPNAHKATWRHERTLLALLAPPRVRGERRLFAIDRRRVLAACREVGFYAGVILLLEDEADAIGDALQTALDAGDEATAKRIAARCDDASVWHTVLQTHPEAALLAIASLRPADAVEVLLGGPEVSEQVTRALLASHERAEQQHDAVRAMLVQMAQQVWRRSDVNVAPQLRTVQSAEQAVVTALAGGAVSASDAAAIKQQLQALFVRTRDSYDVAFDYTSALPRTVEESAHHWGKATDKREQATLCAICGLPLSIDPRTNPLVVGGATNAAAAVVLFANCNHVQHQHCAQLWTAETQTLLSPVACVECCRERSAKFN
jgi:hypothetical protein